MASSQTAANNANTRSLAIDDVLQNRYRIVRQLGKGGMGAVYEALDLRLGITVALKETLSSEERIRKQFEQEARLLAALQHPALPRVSDHFTEDGRAFLVMQFISGVDLAKVIAQQPGPFPTEQVVAWADQLLDALVYLHTRERQIIHRDIKPHNLKLTASGKIALLDFGLAKAQSTDASATSSAPFFGYTRQYAPLEQIRDLATGPQSDIYALGATLYHLFTGVKPADALLRAAAQASREADPLLPADQVNKTLGAELAGILQKAMSQMPEDRYQSAHDFREALRGVGRIKKTPAQNTTPSFKAETDTHTIVKMPLVASERRFGPGLVTLFLVVAALVGIGIYTRYPGQPDSSPRLSSSSLQGQKSASAENEVDGRPESSAKRFDRKNGTRVEEEARQNDAPAAKVSTGKRTPIQAVKAPAVRLPNAELRVTAPQNEQVVPTRDQSKSPAEPQVFRAPDGTQVVKFADGSTRVFRPGERAMQ